MRHLVKGHRYEVSNFDNVKGTQVIQFIQKGLQGTEFITVKDGTTNEELLKVLIDRINFLQAKAPCRENTIVLTKLEEALMWLEKRTADRKARNVEGTPNV